MLKKILLLNFIVLVSGLQNTKVYNIHKKNNSMRNNHTRHSDLFSQYVELSFYENMNQCLNNDKNVINWHDYFNLDCECLNMTGCLNTLFTSNDFKSQHWNLNQTEVFGSECIFQDGRICDMCGSYPVKARVIMYGSTCLNYPVLRFLMALLIISFGVLFTFSIVVCMNKIITNSDGTTTLRRRYGYRRIINDTEKPPNYTQNN